MKLEPRERRVAPNYLIDNADALDLGKLYLGWAVKRKHGAKRPPAATSSNTPVTKKAASKKETKSATAKAPSSKKTTPAAKTKNAIKSRSKSTATLTAQEKGKKQLAKKAAATQQPTRKGQTAQKKSTAKKLQVSIKEDKGFLPVPPLVSADASTSAQQASTPPAGEGFVTPFVRLMDGRTITITANTASLVGDLKQQLYAVLHPGQLMDRPPSLLFNGSAHHADNLTLAQAGLTSNSVIYYF